MLKTGIVRNDKDEPDFSVLSFRERKSTITADGSVLLTSPRGSKFNYSLKSTRVVLMGENNRVPFMAFYQVQHYA